MAQDDLPASLFDTGSETRQLVQSMPTTFIETPPVSNFSRFSSRLPTLSDDDDVVQGDEQAEEDRYSRCRCCALSYH